MDSVDETRTADLGADVAGLLAAQALLTSTAHDVQRDGSKMEVGGIQAIVSGKIAERLRAAGSRRRMAEKIDSWPDSGKVVAGFFGLSGNTKE